MKDVSGLPKELLDRLTKAKNKVLKARFTIRIVSHYDADGICAAGILASALTREQIKFHITLTRSLNDEIVGFLKKEGYPLIIFCDMGSGQLDALAELDAEVIILDHHTALQDSEKPLQINPHVKTAFSLIKAALISAIEISEAVTLLIELQLEHEQ